MTLYAHALSPLFTERDSLLLLQVDLEVHKGFLGGLQQNKTTGDTAPYYATPTCEIVYHVSTRIPEGSEESRHIKVTSHVVYVNILK